MSRLSALTAPKTPPHLGTLILVAALSVMSLNLFLPALAEMSADFGVSYAEMSLAISGYFVATALVQLLISPLSDRYGRRPVMLIGLLIFALASGLASLAPTLPVFLFARSLQCAIVVGSTVGLASLRDTHKGREAARVMGIAGAVMALGPMVAPLLGGALSEAFGWRSNFHVFTALGLAALALCWVDLGETAPARGMSARTQGKAYLSLLANPNFWANALTATFSAAAFFAFITAAPVLGAGYFALNQAEIGLAMAVTPLGFLLGNVLTTQFTRHYAPASLVLVGRGIVVAGMAALCFVSLSDPPSWLFFGLMISVGIGNGLTIPGVYSDAMSIRPELAASAAGLIGTISTGFGGVATAMSGLLISAQPRPITLACLMLALAMLGLATAIAAQRTQPLEKTASPT